MAAYTTQIWLDASQSAYRGTKYKDAAQTFMDQNA